MRHYLESSFGAASETGILFARSGQASLGLYIGSGLQREVVGSVALKALESLLIPRNDDLNYCHPMV